MHSNRSQIEFPKTRVMKNIFSNPESILRLDYRGKVTVGTED